jgi:hypothetical protein
LARGLLELVVWVEAVDFFVDGGSVGEAAATGFFIAGSGARAGFDVFSAISPKFVSFVETFGSSVDGFGAGAGAIVYFFVEGIAAEVDFGDSGGA